MVVLRIEQRIGAPDHFGQAGRVGCNGGPAAGHGFQDRQSEAFVPRRQHEQFAQVVELDQVVIGRVSGQQHFTGQQVVRAGQGFEALVIARLQLADDQQLVPGAQVFRQQGIGPDQSLDVLAAVGCTRIHDEWPRDAVPRQQRLLFRFRHRHWLEMRIGRGRYIDHLLFRIADQVDRFAARRFRNGQQ